MQSGKRTFKHVMRCVSAGLVVFCGYATGDDAQTAVANLRRTAIRCEQDGRVDEAAAAYEEILRQDPTLTRAVAPRLVRLYVEQKNSSDALRWAHVVMQGSPAPREYLAGVHALLDEHTEAILILEDALAASSNNTKRSELLVAMAASHDALGESAAARTNLVQAISVAAGTPQGAVAAARLRELTENERERAARMEATP